MRRSHQLVAILFVSLLIPYAALGWLSLGRGWSFPHLAPDQFDYQPWRTVLQEKSSLSAAVSNTLVMSGIISFSSTLIGLSSGRALRKQQSMLGLFVAYLPFVLSPVIVGTVLYDIEARLGIVSTRAGVLTAQFLFAYSFATVFFFEMWDARIDRLELLVQTLGGGRLAVWRHAILPSATGLLAACLIQTAIFVWLDYGLVSALGGGYVPTVTLMLFSYIREASVNQASQAALLLLIGSIAASVVSALLLRQVRERLGVQS